MQAVEQYLKATDPELTDLKIVMFHTNPKYPDKAYISVSGVRGFATAGGSQQPDYRGFVLIKEGDGWKVAEGNNPHFTDQPEVADRILGGGK
ncbi:MAG TPA: hypothetical protein VNN73_00130 [Blastocatellia bacterium]|nr:hypothetical protein [Blastocatellia bacterium]